ncbi:uncharacterized protein N7487_006648 [Penicillium crustosum]|uniref:uncharacterized protein n=1 Tax=Penicillium crustosum TaxID=36656 RepID=UPI0023820E9A|nr:uncharacterized protein N7487_006648 [Penicillium crustosum]KAJ5412289.1 hypothetical protein N7487_006648 [Penicillium crustosum]
MYMSFGVDGDNGLLPKRDNDSTWARPGAESSRVETPVNQSHARMPGPKRSMDNLVHMRSITILVFSSDIS